MQITIIYVGNIKDKYLAEAITEYEKRLKAYCQLNQIELKEEKIPENPSNQEIQNALKKEGAKIIQNFSNKSYKIALCVEGTIISSEEFSKKIESIKDSYANITFVIGGPYGLAEEVKNACDYKLSISKMTFTHRMARVLLMEQIYRAMNIAQGGKYHK